MRRAAPERRGVDDPSKRVPTFVHSWVVQSDEGIATVFEGAESWAQAGFDAFFVEHHRRLFKALYFVTGDAGAAEDLAQDAFLRLWQRWDEVSVMDDPVGYLFRAALNGARMRRRRALIAARRTVPVTEQRDPFADADMRVEVRRLLLRLTPRQRAALLLVDLLGYPSERAAHILGVRPSTVRALATQGRQALRATEGANDA